MKTMKRTVLVGASMFALVFGASAQVDDAQALQAYQPGWMQSHNVAEMTPADYVQMKADWVLFNSEDAQYQARLAADLQANGLPADFPVKHYTGDAIADENAYQTAKAEWIANSRELYDQLFPAPAPMTEAEQAERMQATNNNQTN